MYLVKYGNGAYLLTEKPGETVTLSSGDIVARKKTEGNKLMDFLEKIDLILKAKEPAAPVEEKTACIANVVRQYASSIKDE